MIDAFTSVALLRYVEIGDCWLRFAMHPFHERAEHASRRCLMCMYACICLCTLLYIYMYICVCVSIHIYIDLSSVPATLSLHTVAPVSQLTVSHMAWHSALTKAFSSILCKKDVFVCFPQNGPNLVVCREGAGDNQPLKHLREDVKNPCRTWGYIITSYLSGVGVGTKMGEVSQIIAKRKQDTLMIRIG